MFQAAESGNLDDFNRLFIAEPARLQVRDSKGRAAVHQAAARNKLNILQFIRNHGGGKYFERLKELMRDIRTSFWEFFYFYLINF